MHRAFLRVIVIIYVSYVYVVYEVVILCGTSEFVRVSV